MRVSERGADGIDRALRAGGLRVRIGPATFRIRSDVVGLPEQLWTMYADYELADAERPADLDIRLVSRAGWRRPVKPQAVFLAEGAAWFEPYPRDHALPMLEWGSNLMFATRMHRFLMLHSAAVARDDRAVLFPAWPASGKTTLSVALACRGWRFLSDEFALVVPGTGEVFPFPRLAPLKNESIPAIRAFAPDAFLGPVFPKTRKGDVAHFRPPAESIRLAQRPAIPRHVVFPSFERGAALELLPIEKPAAFMKLAGNAFNYETLGEDAFHAVSRLIRGCECHILRFGNLEDAVQAVESLES